MGGGALAVDGACCIGESKYLTVKNIVFTILSFLCFCFAFEAALCGLKLVV